MFHTCNFFIISAFNISSHFAFSGALISTTGSIIGTISASQILFANSNCCSTIALIPSSFGSNIFASTLGKAFAIEPKRLYLSSSAAITGDVSVSPYPWIVKIPKLLKALAYHLFYT